MSREAESIRIDWERIRAGAASEQEKVDAAVSCGELSLKECVPQLQYLLGDPSEEVRRYALQALVLDLKEKDQGMASICWKLAESDESEWVRSMAVACLGSILFGSFDRTAYSRLWSILCDESEDSMVREAAHSVLFKLAGYHPSKWPRAKPGSREVFQTSHVNWETLKEIEDKMK